jgi:hypothetical protein
LDSILAKAEGVARTIGDNVQQDRLLVEVALASEGEVQRRLMTEIANRRLGDLGTKNLDREEREIAEVFASVARYLPPDEQGSLASEALRIARSKGTREYDQARAFLALLPNVAPTQQVALLKETRTLARILEKPSEKAEILVALVPLVPPDQTEDAQQEALLAARAAPTSGLSASGTIDMEDGLVTFDRTSNLWRGQLLALLAHRGLPERRASILQEAIDSLEDSDAEAQAVTLMEVAPFLSEPVVSNLIERLREVEADPFRLDVVAIVLDRLAEFESLDVARNEAHDLWGENVPEPVTKVLSGDSPSPHTDPTTEVPDANTPTDRPVAEDAATVNFSISQTYDLTNLYRLTALPASAIGIVTFDSPKVEKGSAKEAELAEEVARSVAAEAVSKLAPEDIGAVLNGLREFQNGESWQGARAALVSRLIELGAMEKAHSASRAVWPVEPPAQVSFSYWQASLDKSQELLLKQTLCSALKTQKPSERARLLGRLLPDLPEPKRASIVSEIATAASTILTDSRTEHLDDELLQIFSSLPKTSLLGVWHDAMRKLEVRNRKEMLIALPPLLLLGARLTQGRLWSEAAAAIRTVRRQWP